MRKLVALLLILIILNLFIPLKSQFDDIPKIIHQTAMADESKWNPVWKKCQQTWKDKFPDFEYRMWTDEDLENIIKTKYEWFYETYKAYDVNIKRIDVARYFILHEHGGIYADMDYECINNFWDQLDKNKVSIASFENALMVSPKHDTIWLNVFAKLKSRMNKHTIDATGPVLIHEVKNEYPGSIDELPDSDYKSQGGKYAIHHGTGSWITTDGPKATDANFSILR